MGRKLSSNKCTRSARRAGEGTWHVLAPPPGTDPVCGLRSVSTGSSGSDMKTHNWMELDSEWTLTAKTTLDEYR